MAIQRRTYKNMQDEVLAWMGDEGDTGALRDLVKLAIRDSHEKRLTNSRWSFMAHPHEFSFTTVAGQKSYSLHDAFHTPMYFYPDGRPDYPLTEIPWDMVLQHLPADGTGAWSKFHLNGVSAVKNQPPDGGSTVNVNGLAADETVTIIGETAGGSEEETLTDADPTGNVVFVLIHDVRKDQSEYAGEISLAYATGGAEVVTLPAAVFGRQYRQLTFLRAPNEATEILYRFFRAPKTLTEDNDIPDTPFPFQRIHVLDALLDMQGYTRATAAEVKRWENELTDLEQDLLASYQSGLTLNADQSYTTYIPR